MRCVMGISARNGKKNVVGTGRFELPTCRLGGDRSIHLSYVPDEVNCTSV